MEAPLRSVSELASSLDLLKHAIQERRLAAERHEDRSSTMAWTQWARDALQGGARKAHSWTRPSRPADHGEDAEGLMMGREILEGQAEKFGALWRCRLDMPSLDRSRLDQGGELTGDMLMKDEAVVRLL